MRRILTALASVLALVLAAPGVALAHHGHGARHSRTHHKGHAKGARVLRLAPVEGGKSTSEPGTQTTSSTSTEDIGTVSSIEGEVLTIKLNDGSLVSGKLTEDTHVICISSKPTEGDDDNGEGDDDHSSDGGWHQGGGGPEGTSSQEGGKEGEAGPTAHDSSFDGQGGPGCEEKEKALVVGATVKEAELRFTSAGASWESLVIVQ